MITLRFACLAACLLFACSEPEARQATTAPEPGEASAIAAPELSASANEWRPVDPPAAESSLGASLTATADGVIGTWIEPVADGHRVRVATLRDREWSAPATVVSGDDLVANWADFPRAARSGNGSIFVHYLRRAGEAAHAYEIQIARSRDGARTFEALGVLHHDGTPTEHGFVSLVPEGEGVRVFWLDGRETLTEGGATAVYTAHVETEIDAESRVDERACDCCQTDAAVGADGPLVVFRDRDTEEHRDVAIARRDGEGFAEARVVRDDGWRIAGCPVNGPAIDADGRDVVVAWFTGARGGAVQAAFSTDAGRSFGSPIVVDGAQPPGRVDARLLEDGAAVSWLARTDNGAEVRVRFVERDGRVARSTVVGRTDTARASGFPVLVRDGDRLVVAYRDASSPPRVRVATLALEALPRTPGSEPPARRASLAVGAMRPDAHVLAADDARVSLAALGDGGPLLLAFFARWCQPCREELQMLERVRARLPTGVRLVVVSLDEGPATRAEAVARRWGFGGRVVRDAGAASALGVPPIPGLFLFDAEGRLSGRWVGEPVDEETVMRSVLPDR